MQKYTQNYTYTEVLTFINKRFWHLNHTKKHYFYMTGDSTFHIISLVSLISTYSQQWSSTTCNIKCYCAEKRKTSSEKVQFLSLIIMDNVYYHTN